MVDNVKIFPTAPGSNVSGEFDVSSKPKILKIFGIPRGVNFNLEMASNEVCGRVWDSYIDCNCTICLNHNNRVARVVVPGTYRLVASPMNPDDTLSMFDLSSVVISQEIDVSSPLVWK